MHSFAHKRDASAYKREVSNRAPSTPAETRGLVMNLGWRYDLMVGLFNELLFRGQLRGLLRRAAVLAQLRPGDAVLDAGCGTGTLALMAQERLGWAGRVAGIDPGPRRIERARRKAVGRRALVDFRIGVMERLPFPDRSFDVVLSTPGQMRRTQPRARRL